MHDRAFVLQKGTWLHLSSSLSTLGSRTERMGPQATRHRQHGVGVLHGAHGKLLQGWQGRWEGRQGANAFLQGPRPSSATQMQEKRRQGRRSPKPGKPSARWARGVKEAPTGAGPSLAATSRAQGSPGTGGSPVEVGARHRQRKSMGHRESRGPLSGPLQPARSCNLAPSGPSLRPYQPGTRHGGKRRTSHAPLPWRPRGTPGTSPGSTQSHNLCTHACQKGVHPTIPWQAQANRPASP
jgi:hypothetical protein